MDEYEVLSPFYFDLETLGHKPPIMFRRNAAGKRLYYSFTEQGDYISMPSVTTIIKEVMPTSQYLIDWIAQYGKLRADQIAYEKASYGTLLHIAISSFLKNRTFNLDTIAERIETYRMSEKITFDTHSWKFELAKDMLSFAKFANVHHVEALAISVMLYSLRGQYAGELDLVAEMDIGTGQNGTILARDKNPLERIRCIIDFKSGRKGFYAEHEVQLHLYKDMWNENYPNFPVERVFNFSPKEWLFEPGFNLKEQTGSVHVSLLNEYLKIYYALDEQHKIKQYPAISGELRLGEETDNLKLEEYEEVARRIHQVPIKNNELTILRVPVPETPTPEKKSEPIPESNVKEGQEEAYEEAKKKTNLTFVRPKSKVKTDRAKLPEEPKPATSDKQEAIDLPPMEPMVTGLTPFGTPIITQTTEKVPLPLENPAVTMGPNIDADLDFILSSKTVPDKIKKIIADEYNKKETIIESPF